jgi:hypothetical protein
MSEKTDWMPQGKEAIHDFIIRVYVYVIANAERFCLDKSTRLGDWLLLEFTPEYNSYLSAYNVCQDPVTDTPGAEARLKVTEDKLFPLFRELCGFLKANPLVSNPDLIEMGLPQKATHEHHPAPIADKAPSFEIIPIEGNRLRIFFYPEGAKSRKGKPAGQHGAEIKWGFFDPPMFDAEKLPHSLFDTASPYTLQFNEEDIGKTVCIALRWENNRGLKGPWSIVSVAHVP